MTIPASRAGRWLADQLEALEAENDFLRALNAELADKVRHLTKLLDDQMGTPCEQMRHAEEIVELQKALQQIVNEGDDLSILIARAAIAKAKG